MVWAARASLISRNERADGTSVEAGVLAINGKLGGRALLEAGEAVRGRGHGAGVDVDIVQGGALSCSITCGARIDGHSFAMVVNVGTKIRSISSERATVKGYRATATHVNTNCPSMSTSIVNE